MCLLGHSKRVRLIPIKKIQFAMMTNMYILFFKHYFSHTVAFSAFVHWSKKTNIFLFDNYSIWISYQCIVEKMFEKKLKKFTFTILYTSTTNLVIHEIRLDTWIDTVSKKRKTSCLNGGFPSRKSHLFCLPKVSMSANL